MRCENTPSTTQTPSLPLPAEQKGNPEGSFQQKEGAQRKISKDQIGPKCEQNMRTSLLSLVLVGTAAAAKITRAQLLKTVAGCVFAAPIACEVYARLPAGWSVQSLPLLPQDALEASKLIIVIPGAGGPDANTERIVTSLQKASPSGSKVLQYDWAAFVGDQLQAPHNAEKVGTHLADMVLSSEVESLHVVGISVGAFVADRVVRRVAEAARRGARTMTVHETLLDPFTARSLPGLVRPSSAYGVGAFGRNADIAECVLNTDDPVPSTNLPLRHAVNFDIVRHTAASRIDVVFCSPAPSTSPPCHPSLVYPLRFESLLPTHNVSDELGAEAQLRPTARRFHALVASCVLRPHRPVRNLGLGIGLCTRLSSALVEVKPGSRPSRRPTYTYICARVLAWSPLREVRGTAARLDGGRMHVRDPHPGTTRTKRNATRLKV
jgi:hypothetical protein